MEERKCISCGVIFDGEMWEDECEECYHEEE